jgi:prepilin-type N-terminal cleavage/methylation domain-containing protein
MWVTPKRSHPGAFTLIELLVAVGIIALLAALLLPSLGSAKAQGKRANCISNLQQIEAATQMYVYDHGIYPPAWIDSQTLWMELVNPYISEHSRVFLCPADMQQIPVEWDTNIFLSYGMNVFNFAGAATCFWYGVKADLVHTPAKTIIYADCTPGDYWCGSGSSFTNPVPYVDYRHPKGGFVAAYCDDHVESKTITIKAEWDVSE